MNNNILTQNKIKVSVIIPAYNAETFLSRTIQSALNQTFRDFELIIVDDGSTDNTKEIVRKFQVNNSQIKYFLKENSGGPAGPKNLGLKKSKGKFIAFLDHDDEWLPEKLEEQVESFENSTDSKLGIIICYPVLVHSNKKKIFEIPSLEEETFKKILLGNFIYSCSGVMIKKEVIEKVGYFDEKLKYADDWDMWIRIIFRYNLSIIKKPLFYHHIRGENVSLTMKNRKKVREEEYIYQKHFNMSKKYLPLYSEQLRVLGLKYFLLNEKVKARKFFYRSMLVFPLNYKTYFYYFLSLLGKNLFKKFYYERNVLKFDNLDLY